MTTPSEPTPPTLEQRAATINDLCPEGWSVRPSGSSLAIINPKTPDMPPAVIHSDDAGVVATIWTWHTRALEIEAHERGHLHRIVDEITAVFGCPDDIDSLPAKVRAMDELHAPGGEVGVLRTELERLRTDEAALVTECNRLNKSRDEAQAETAVWRERFDKHEADIRQIAAAYFDAGLGGAPATPGKVAERLKELGQVRRAMATLEARHATATAERDESWATLRAIGLRDSESTEEFEARIAAEFKEAKQWREMDKRARVETTPGDPVARAVSIGVGLSDAAMVAGPNANRPAAKPERNVLDEVRGLGEATERFDRAATEPAKLALDVDGSITVTGVDGPVPVRAPSWTGITWMSGKGRAKSLTLPGLRLVDETGERLNLRVEPEALTKKLESVLNKAFRKQRRLTFHYTRGKTTRGFVLGYVGREAPGMTRGDIFVQAPRKAAPRKWQGIAWRRPGHDVDSFAEVPIRPTYDAAGNHVIEVRTELPQDLQHEIKQTSRDRPTITVTTANGATLKGPITAWQVQRGEDGVVWRLTMPLSTAKPVT